LATGCEVNIEKVWGATYDLRQNRALASEVANVTLNKYGTVDYHWGISSASTDFVSEMNCFLTLLAHEDLGKRVIW